MLDNIIPIHTASVKVMRSHDYCHFEICLGNNLPLTPVGVDELRKVAARLADKAVEQYKVAKASTERRYSNQRSADYLREEAQAVELKPETERTPNEQAILKTYKDHVFEANRAYDYEDDWQGDDDV